MPKKMYIRSFLLLIAAALVLFVTGCGTKEKPESGAQVQAGEGQLYTCGMHPNVIQEEPGNCPICGMKLNPVGGGATTASSAATSGGEKKILYYRAPMDPTYISPKPGKSPMGMDLIPVYEGEEAFGATVRINPVVEQNIGVRTAKTERRNLTRKIRTIGRIDYDESRVSHIHTKFSGWIDKTYVNTTGQFVRKGERLLDIYSPELVSAQEEYLDALANLRQAKGSVAKENLENILFSTKKRLEYFDISEAQIEEMAKTNIVNKTMEIESPFTGIVVEKHALDGMEVKPGMSLYVIADLSEIWVYADIYEFESPWVKEGQQAIMTLSYEPGKKYYGKVQYVYPYLEEKTRTIKVRLSFPNPNMDLKPGMYANVEIHTSPIENAVVVPMEAVLFSGERNLVFVALGEGRFAPRDVVVGLESGDGYYQILDGLKEGETVVTSAQFLLDSESKLQESIAKMLASRKGDNESPTGDDPTEPSYPETGDKDTKKMNPTGKSSESKMKMDMDMNMDMDMGTDKDMKMDMKGGKSMKSEPISFGTVKDGILSYYTCPMESHSFVKMKEPGTDPECGMNLVQKQEPYDPEQTYYTCPMPEHSYVVMKEPGNCPVCGMNLIVLK